MQEGRDSRIAAQSAILDASAYGGFPKIVPLARFPNGKPPHQIQDPDLDGAEMPSG